VERESVSTEGVELTSATAKGGHQALGGILSAWSRSDVADLTQHVMYLKKKRESRRRKRGKRQISVGALGGDSWSLSTSQEEAYHHPMKFAKKNKEQSCKGAMDRVVDKRGVLLEGAEKGAAPKGGGIASSELY